MLTFVGIVVKRQESSTTQNESRINSVYRDKQSVGQMIAYKYDGGANMMCIEAHNREIICTQNALPSEFSQCSAASNRPFVCDDCSPVCQQVCIQLNASDARETANSMCISVCGLWGVHSALWRVYTIHTFFELTITHNALASNKLIRAHLTQSSASICIACARVLWLCWSSLYTYHLILATITHMTAREFAQARRLLLC